MLSLPEENLELRELRYVLDQAAFTAVLSERGHLLEVNEKLERAFGYRSHELKGRSFHAFLHEELSFQVHQSLRLQLGRHGSWFGELCFRTKHGRPLWAECRLVRLPGAATRYHCIAFDITERKAVESSLAANQVFSRTLMEMAPVGIFLADAGGGCTYVNKCWTELSGLRLRDAILPGWETAVHPDDREATEDAWRDYVNGGESFCREFRYVSQGRVRYVLATAVRLDSQPGPRSRFLRVEQDLSELKRTERLINEQRVKMLSAAKMTALGEMAGGIAHEINNPLAIIQGNAELLRYWTDSDTLSPARLKEVSETLMTTTSRITKIIKALRAIARNADHDPFEPTLIGPLVEYVVSLSRARARDERIQVEVVPIPAGITLSCRPAQVSQILLNLLNNAFHACDGPEKWVKVEVLQLPTSVEIAVTDSGSGIAPRLREKLFQPFFTTKPVGTGMGLGLSVAGSLAAGHGGRLYLDPESPATRFVLSLPRRAPTGAT